MYYTKFPVLQQKMQAYNQKQNEVHGQHKLLQFKTYA